MINLRFKLLVFCIISIGCNTLTKEDSKKIRIEDSKTRKEVKEQDDGIYFLFNNDNINYNIVLVPDRSEFPVISYYRVDIDSVNDSKIHELRSITSDSWLFLLNNEKTDWAANIVLYYFYQRDAFELSKYENPNRWRKFMKPRDVKYWQTVFNEKNMPIEDNVPNELVE